MRDSLKKSVQDSPVKGFDRYPKGSVVLCNACSLPIAILDSAIELGDGGGKSASKFKPLSVEQMHGLQMREDIDPGISVRLRGMSQYDIKAHCEKLHEFRTGMPMLCPACGGCFVQVLSVEAHEVLDKSYTMELLTIPPFGYSKPAPVRGKRIGAHDDWVHEGGVH